MKKVWYINIIRKLRIIVKIGDNKKPDDNTYIIS